MLYHARLRPGMRRLKVIRACCVSHNSADTKSLDYLESPLDEETFRSRKGQMMVGTLTPVVVQKMMSSFNKMNFKGETRCVMHLIMNKVQ